MKKVLILLGLAVFISLLPYKIESRMIESHDVDHSYMNGIQFDGEYYSASNFEAFLIKERRAFKIILREKKSLSGIVYRTAYLSTIQV